MAGNQLHAGVASWYYRQSHGAVEVEVKGICLQAQALLVGNCLFAQYITSWWPILPPKPQLASTWDISVVSNHDVLDYGCGVELRVIVDKLSFFSRQLKPGSRSKEDQIHLEKVGSFQRG